MNAYKEFIISHPLEFMFNIEDSKLMRKALKKANRDYVLQHTEKREGDYIFFEVWCPTTSFSMAYYVLGRMMNEFRNKIVCR